MSTEIKSTENEFLDQLNIEISELESQDWTTENQQKLDSKKYQKEILELNMVQGTGTFKQAFHKAY